MPDMDLARSATTGDVSALICTDGHDWETAGIWGVVEGVSRCRRCGETFRMKSDAALRARSTEGGEG